MTGDGLLSKSSRDGIKGTQCNMNNDMDWWKCGPFSTIGMISPCVQCTDRERGDSSKNGRDMKTMMLGGREGGREGGRM